MDIGQLLLLWLISWKRLNSRRSQRLSVYSTALNYFTECCRKLYLHEIERYDLLKFASFLRDEKKQSPRSVYNKFETVMTFLKANGIRGLMGKNDWPRYTEEEPEMFEHEELDKTFKACNAEERLWYEFFLMTGMREQEVMYTYWSDVNLTASTVRVSHKPDKNWTPKAYKAREIPIPSKLAKKLKARKAKADKTCGLVFPTSACNPKLDFLDCLKVCAGRAELNKTTSGRASFVRLLRLVVSGLEWICERFSSGLVTATWNRQRGSEALKE